MKTLVIDVGGTHVKLLASGHEEAIKVPSGPNLTPQQMVEEVLAATPGWEYGRISIGVPGPVVHGHVIREPINLGQGWVGFDFAHAFGWPARIMNDAAMQALGSYEGGRMLFIGLGTGMGTSLIIDGTVAPMELAHLPYRKGRSFEDYVGQRGLDRFGKRKWRHFVSDVACKLGAAVVADYIVLGGGNVRKLKEMPVNCRLGDNRNAFRGGFRLWDDGDAAADLSAYSAAVEANSPASHPN
jgi:predicted NBD/HSP70 family sugar kinase